jgi:hypothetical protein
MLGHATVAAGILRKTGGLYPEGRGLEQVAFPQQVPADDHYKRTGYEVE